MSCHPWPAMDNWTSVLLIRGLCGSLTRYAARPGERSRLSQLPNFGPIPKRFIDFGLHEGNCDRLASGIDTADEIDHHAPGVQVFCFLPFLRPFSARFARQSLRASSRLVSRGASITFDDLAVDCIVSNLGIRVGQNTQGETVADHIPNCLLWHLFNSDGRASLRGGREGRRRRSSIGEVLGSADLTDSTRISVRGVKAQLRKHSADERVSQFQELHRRLHNRGFLALLERGFHVHHQCGRRVRGVSRVFTAACTATK